MPRVLPSPLSLALALSVALHVASVGVLPPAAKPVAARPASLVSFETHAVAPPKAHPEPAPEPTKAPPPRPARPAPAKALAAPELPAPDQPARIAESAPVDPAIPPADESSDAQGNVLTGDGSWSLPGTGRATPARQRPSAPRPKPKPAPPPALVPLRDLSRRPSPPALGAALRQNYPVSARRQGEPGNASVAARIDADGRVRSARVLSASAPEFGTACRQTVIGSLWSPPLDRDGRAVSTEVRYRCRFEVAP